MIDSLHCPPYFQKKPIPPSHPHTSHRTKQTQFPRPPPTSYRAKRPHFPHPVTNLPDSSGPALVPLTRPASRSTVRPRE